MLGLCSSEKEILNKMRIIESGDINFKTFFKELNEIASLDNEAIVSKTKEIIGEIKSDKDEALKRHISMFDRWEPKSIQDIEIPKDSLKEAYENLDDNLREALVLAKERIQKYHQKQLPKSWIDFEENGSMLGVKITPVFRAGLYIPGGKASYPSSMLMNAIPAKVAGVKEVVACVPAPNNEINPLVLAAAFICDVDMVFKVGGASAIAAFAFGTNLIPKCDVVSGPGNIFVATAKKLLFGEVNIDMIAGPSEIGIIADCSADANLIATDLLSQAEHDELARAILITDDKELAQNVVKEIEKEIEVLPRKEIAKASISNRSAIIIASSIEEAINLMNKIAPEHLEIITKNPYSLLPLIQNAGAIFLGNNSPEAIGDYIAGPNHTLPTSSTARFFSPLGVENFLKRSSIISISNKGLLEIGEAATLLAKTEGLDAHRLSIEKRLKKIKGE